MQRTLLGALCIGALTLGASGPAIADEASEKKDIKALNELTGLEPVEGTLQRLLDNSAKTKELIKAALPLAKEKKGLTYNAALLLAMAAADQKDLKASDAFFRVCGDIAAKEQSTRKLAQAYGTLIELYYDNKQYADAARICREVLALKTDDGKQRVVYKAFTDERGDTDFNEYATFDAAKPLRPVVERYLVETLTKQGKFNQALKLADGLIKGGTDWRGQRLKATVLRESGEFAEAARLYEGVLKQVQRDADLEPEERDLVVERVRAELSNVYVEAHQVDKAAEQLEILLKKRPDEPTYYNDLGYVLADHDMRLDEAEQMIRKALELDKERRQKNAKFDPKTDHDNGAYLDSLGWVLYKKKQLTEARKYLQLAIEDKNTQHIEIYDHLGDVCLEMGDREAALRAWEEGLKFVTDTRRDQGLRGRVEKKLEKLKSKSASK
jgi:tetratricopeptide (TPR) repeat protein